MPEILIIYCGKLINVLIYAIPTNIQTKKKRIIFFLMLFFTPFSCIFGQPLIYGVTQGGGQGIGTISKFSPTTHSFDTFYSFKNTPIYPQYLFQSISPGDTKFYGYTSRGSNKDDGHTIISIDPATKEIQKLYDFKLDNTPTGSTYTKC